jgi:hypothetical protein
MARKPVPTSDTLAALNDRLLADFDATPVEPRRGILGAPVGESADGPGMLESAVRGVKQGVTMGFGDEITGALEAAVTSKTYKQARDEARAADKAAKEANPVTFGLGQIFGGVGTAVVPVGAAAKIGTGVAAAAARGAGAGIVAGAGESEAETVPEMVQDAAKGGLVGAAAGGALGGLAKVFGRYVANAPARADKKLLSDVGIGATPKVYREINAKGADVVEKLRETGLEGVAHKPEVLAVEGKATLDKFGKQIGDAFRKIDDVQSKALAEGKMHLAAAKNEGAIATKAVREYFEKADEVTNGLPLSRLTREVRMVAANRAKSGDAEGAADLLKALGKVEAGAEKGIADPPIPLGKLAASHPEVASAAQGAVEKHLATTLKRNPDLGSMEMFQKLKDVAAKAPGRALEAEDRARLGLDVALDDITKAIRRVAAGRKKVGDVAGYKAAKSEADGLAALWGDRGKFKGQAFVPAADVHAFVSGLGNRAYDGMKPGAAGSLTGRIWAAVKDVMDSHIDDVAKRNPGLPGLDELRELNKTYSALAPVVKAAEYKAMRAKMSPTGLRQIAGETQSAMAGAAALASGNPLPLLLTKPVMDAAEGANRAVTRALARLVRARRDGETIDPYVRDAIESGVPRGLIETVVGQTTPQAAAEQ